jgi:hypothetical protein
LIAVASDEAQQSIRDTGFVDFHLGFTLFGGESCDSSTDAVGSNDRKP